MDALRSEAQSLEIVLRAFTRQIQTRVAACNRKRNSITPFHSLPTEIIGDVFSLSFDNLYARSYDFGALHKLASVSHAWWQIVKTHPQLWACISLSRPETVPLMLQRSGTLPLSIRWLEGRPAVGGTPREAIMLLCTQRHRWRELDISCRRVGVWDEALKSPLPLLESLALDVSRGKPVDLATFVGGPRLTELILFNVLPPTDARAFAGLETLHLDSIPGLLQADRLLSILVASKSLVELRLNNINISAPRTNDGQPSEESMTLKTVAVLALTHCSSRTVTTLLSKISCPSLESLTIAYKCAHGEIEGRRVLWHLFHTDEGSSLWTTPVVRRAGDKVEVRLEHENLLKIQANGLSISIEGTAFTPLLDTLDALPAFPFHHVGSIPIHIHINSSSEAEPDELDENLLLRMVPSVKFVSLTCPFSLTIEALDVLGQTNDLERDGEWPCPLLERMTITCYEDGARKSLFMRAVRAMVRDRRSAMDEGLAELSVEVRGADGVMIGVENGM